jgi:hypothetical protein
MPSPDIRAFTPVCAGYGGEGAITIAALGYAATLQKSGFSAIGI